MNHLCLEERKQKPSVLCAYWGEAISHTFTSSLSQACNTQSYFTDLCCMIIND